MDDFGEKMLTVICFLNRERLPDLFEKSQRLF